MGDVSHSESRVSPTSFSCLVILVNGKLGFIDGFRLMVPGKTSGSSNSSIKTHALLFMVLTHWKF